MGRLSRSWLAAMIAMLVIALTGCGNGSDSLSSAGKPSAPSATGTGQAEQKQQPSKAEQPPQSTEGSKAQETSQAPLTGFKDVSDYIRQHQKLPANFITKKDAEQLGWVAAKGNLHKVAPGKSIGGDRFSNREKLLPEAKKRIWYEADIHYKEGPRGADRILYSNDGLIYMTTDHYKSFTDITKEGSVRE
ncbi:hypothetical protein GCM10020370_03920 [Paenibacillus hodogayensis]